MTTYQKFYNPPAYPGENGPAAVEPTAYPIQVQPALVANSQAPFVQQPRKELKSLASLRRLVRVELVLALAMILFESIVDGVVATLHVYYPGSGACSLGTGVWAGVLGVVAAGLGLGAFRSPYGNKCMMVAYFVMSVICAVADGIMIVFASICLTSLPWMIRSQYIYSPQSGDFVKASTGQVALGRGLLATESLLLLAAAAHFISSIVSTAFICRNWCQDSQPAVAVVYFPGTAGANQPTADNGGVETSSDPCRIAVPSGAHVQQYVIFVPMVNANQAELSPGTTPQQQLPQPDFHNVQGFEDEKRA